MKTQEDFIRDLEYFDHRKKAIQQWIDETLRYLGQSHFEIHISHMKVVITLTSGSEFYFLYSLSQVARIDIVGAVITGMMDRTTE